MSSSSTTPPPRRKKIGFFTRTRNALARKSYRRAVSEKMKGEYARAGLNFATMPADSLLKRRLQQSFSKIIREIELARENTKRRLDDKTSPLTSRQIRTLKNVYQSTIAAKLDRFLSEEGRTLAIRLAISESNPPSGARKLLLETLLRGGSDADLEWAVRDVLSEKQQHVFADARARYDRLVRKYVDYEISRLSI